MSSFQSQVGVPSFGLCLKLADFGDALKMFSGACSAPSSSSNEDLIVVYLELSVRFEELREEFNHLIECHWVPLQRFSQGVLASLSVLATAPINEGLYCGGCGGCILSPIPQSGDRQGDPTPVPSSFIIPQVQSSGSLPKLESVSSSSFSSSYPSPPSDFLDFRSRVWERLEEGARQLSEEEFQALFPRAEGDSSESRTAARMEVERFYSWLWKEYGLVMAQEAMERSIRDHWIELEHDVMGVLPLLH